MDEEGQARLRTARGAHRAIRDGASRFSSKAPHAGPSEPPRCLDGALAPQRSLRRQTALHTGAMPETVTLALVGEPAQPGARLEESEWERPWAGRPTVELEVEPEESLASVVERALAAFGVKVPPMPSLRSISLISAFTMTRLTGHESGTWRLPMIVGGLSGRLTTFA